MYVKCMYVTIMDTYAFMYKLGNHVQYITWQCQKNKVNYSSIQARHTSDH